MKSPKHHDVNKYVLKCLYSLIHKDFFKFMFQYLDLNYAKDRYQFYVFCFLNVYMDIKNVTAKHSPYMIFSNICLCFSDLEDVNTDRLHLDIW